MKKIEMVDQLMKRPMPAAQDMTYRQGFLTCLNTYNTNAQTNRDPYESVKIVALSTRLYDESPDWILEEAEFELVKKATEQNTIGFFAFIQGQLLNKLKEAGDLKYPNAEAVRHGT